MLAYRTVNGTFSDEVYRILAAFESPERKPYDAGDRVITIGPGYNLTSGDAALRIVVMQQFGLKTEVRNSTNLSEIALLEQGYIARLDAALSAGSSQIATLHQIMNERATRARNEPAFAEFIGDANPRRRFEFSAAAAGDAEMRAAMNEGIKPYVKKTNNRLGFTTDTNTAQGFKDSWEQLTLISLAYNGFGVWPQELTTAIKTGDRAEAWFQIRYRSNYIGRKYSQEIALSTVKNSSGVSEQDLLGNGTDRGWARRRYAEAELFGLYGDRANISSAEAKDIYKMLQKNREAIIAYEKTYGQSPDGAAGATFRGNMVATANTYANLFTTANSVPNLTTALTPAYTAFLAYANTLKATGSAEIDQSVISNAAAIYFQGDNAFTTILDARADDARTGNKLNNNLLVGGAGNDTIYGGTGSDYLFGAAGKDNLDGGADNDYLTGGTGNDKLTGGDGFDTYYFSAGDGKDTITDSDGRGEIQVAGTVLRGADANQSRLDPSNPRATIWKDTSGATYTFIEADAGKGTLLIAGDPLGGGEIRVENFDMNKAQDVGYLGIKLKRDPQILIKDALEKNPFTIEGFNVGSVSGSSSLAEGAGKAFTIYLNYAAGPGGKIILAVAGALASSLKAILGDSTVDANGAEITLTEGQTFVSFSLVSDSEISADQLGSISAQYQTVSTQSNGSGGNSPVSSNSWGLTLKDAGEQDNTLRGDYRVKTAIANSGIKRLTTTNQEIIVVSAGQSYYVRNSEGNLIADAAGQLVTDNALFGGAGKDKIEGLTGSDLIGGYGGNDMIDGGEGADMIGGGAGADHIQGGDGDDYISGSADVNKSQQAWSSTDAWAAYGLPAGKEALTAQARWGSYIEGAGEDAVTVWSGIGATREDTAATEGDVIDAGAGDDWVIASWAADRIKGGTGDDQIDGLAGDDIIEGNEGDDNLSGDGIVKAGYLNSVDAQYHGADFIDGGEGKDQIDGQGGADQLFGGDGDDKIFGDTGVKSDSRYFVDLQYQGDDYIDGEGGNDYIEGNKGDDTIYGGEGDDNLSGDQAADKLSTSEAKTRANWGNDYLDGEAGKDTLSGEGGDDMLYGGDDDDVLFGDDADGALDKAVQGQDYLDGEDGKRSPTNLIANYADNTTGKCLKRFKNERIAVQKHKSCKKFKRNQSLPFIQPAHSAIEFVATGAWHE